MWVYNDCVALHHSSATTAKAKRSACFFLLDFWYIVSTNDSMFDRRSRAAKRNTAKKRKQRLDLELGPKNKKLNVWKRRFLLSVSFFYGPTNNGDTKLLCLNGFIS